MLKSQRYAVDKAEKNTQSLTVYVLIVLVLGNTRNSEWKVLIDKLNERTANAVRNNIQG